MAWAPPLRKRLAEVTGWWSIIGCTTTGHTARWRLWNGSRRLAELPLPKAARSMPRVRRKRIVAAALAAFGRLDTLVLNAGISGPATKVGEGDTALADVMGINFFANAALVEAALPASRESPAGRIVFVSSTGGLHGVRGRAAYAASKGAVNGWALSLADELRRTAIKVNVIAPYAATNMTARPDRGPDDRMSPANAAEALVALCSPEWSRTGDIWVAGAGHVRPARALEGAVTREPASGTAGGTKCHKRCSARCQSGRSG